MFKRKRQPTLKKDQKYIEDIVSLILSKEGHRKILFGDDAYLMWEEVSVCIRPSRVLISDSTHLFDEPFSSSFTYDMRGLVVEGMRKEVQKIKDEVFSNKMDLLRKVFLNIKKE